MGNAIAMPPGVAFPGSHGVRRRRGARTLFACALVAFSFGVAADALAQFGGGFPGSGGGGMRGSRGGRDRSASQQQPQQREAQRPDTGVNMLELTIEELRIDLKLEPVQVPAWEAYISKARLFASDIARERMSSTASTQTSALKRIDRAVDAARNRLAALEEISDSAKALYALLTPDQRVIADPRLAALVPEPGGAYVSRPARAAVQAPPPGNGTP